MTFPNIGEISLNKISVPNSFKSFSKQVDQKESAQNIDKKKNQNNYFRAELSQKYEKILTLNGKKTDWLLIIGKIYVFLTSNLYKNKFANWYMLCEKLAIIFDINTLKLI